MILSPLSKLFYKLHGWKYEIAEGALDDPKQVAIGFPHTTNMDTVRAAALFYAIENPFHVLVKQELFQFPVSSLLKKMGFIPVDRKRSSNVVKDMTERFSNEKEFTLLIAPEATRGKKGEKRVIRTGFWHIAKAANVPIVFMLSDSAQKVGRIFGKIYPSDDMDADLQKIKEAYAKYDIAVELPEKRE